LVLKLIADVGLLGEPNAGKSTLLAALSAARPKIAPYPFTTLTPNLGVVALSDNRSFVMADIPGIIEGAHAGKGLGDRFLQHVERTRVLAYLVPLDRGEVAGGYEMLRAEARAYSEALAAKPHILVLTKLDLWPPERPLPQLEAPGAAAVLAVSAVARRGLEELKEALWQLLARERSAAEAGELQVPVASSTSRRKSPHQSVPPRELPG
jgi:GTP-binding protein